MSWWISILLMAVAVGLWLKGRNNSDDVIGFLEKLLATAAALVVLLFGHNLLLELLTLAVAMRLPQAGGEITPRPKTRDSDSVLIRF